MYSFLKAFLVLMKLLSLSQFYAPKTLISFANLNINHNCRRLQEINEKTKLLNLLNFRSRNRGTRAIVAL